MMEIKADTVVNITVLKGEMIQDFDWVQLETTSSHQVI